MAPTVVLHYFDFKGLAEGIRMLLKHVGVEFEDKRYSFEDWAKVKAQGGMCFGQLPVLEKDGKKISQSIAIAHAIGDNHGLMAKDHWERAKAMELTVAFLDNATKVASVMQHKEDKAAAKKAYDEVMSTFVMPRLKIYEEHFKNSKSGFVCSEDWVELCWADFMIYNFISAFCHFYEPDRSQFPCIKAFREKVEALPSMKEYLPTRKDITFAPVSAVALTR